MLNGKRFRLKIPTAAIESVDGRRIAVIVPADSTIKAVSDARHGNNMIDVLWEGRIVSMFAVDVETRGEEIFGRAFRA